MIIIFEGLDNVGKSTQIAAIKKHFYPMKQFHTLHYSGVKKAGITSEEYKEFSEEYYEQMFEIFTILQEEGYHLICDRSHIGEAVYGPIYRHYDGDYIFDIEEYANNCMRLDFEKVYLITLIDSVDNLISRDDGLSFTTDMKKKQQEIDLFIEAHNKSMIPNKLLLNIQNRNIQQVTDYILEFLSGNDMLEYALKEKK